MTFYDILVHAALIVWTLIGLGALFSAMIVGPRLLGTMGQIDDMADIVKHRALPAIEQSQEVLDQLSRVSTTLADDFEVVDHTIIRAAESVERMVELTEERVAEVNALLSIAIEEAEDTLVSTAGLIRGVRSVLPGGKRKKRSWLPGSKRRRFG
ncbi:MAG: hypothetical protein PVF05_07485 [Gemmatimonadales bacterium]